MNNEELFVDGYNLPKQLSKDELCDLFDKMKQGDISSREKIIEHNIRFVLYEVMNKFKLVDYDKKDLVSIGIIGLMKAVDTFDISKKIKFATYAIRCIDNEILMFLRKIKRDQNIDSIDRIITVSKSDKGLTLGDVLSDDTDFVDDLIDNEFYQIIHKVVSNLPERDKYIIMMHFGLGGENKYTQSEIAKKLNITQGYVSRLVSKIVKELRRSFEQCGVIEGCIAFEIQDEEKVGRRLKTIYELLKEYTKEQVDEMLSELTEAERTLVTLRYGEDLDHPQTSEKWSNENRKKFYNSLLPKMRNILSNKGEQTKTTTTSEVDTPMPKLTNDDSVVLSESATTQSNVVTTNFSQNIPEQTDEVVTNYLEITEEDYFKVLELLKTPVFNEIMNKYSPKEAIIMSLKLGYIDGKLFSTTAIANFLGMDTVEVTDIIKNILLEYRKKLTEMIDCVLKKITEETDLPTEPQREASRKKLDNHNS